VTFELSAPTQTALAEVADPRMTVEDVALIYRLCLASSTRVEWGKINRAIVDRWGHSGLAEIKAAAWRAGK
jgi:hypothetical protein